MEEKQKILLCGDVEGKFDALFNRVSAINKKAGPFEALFCVGNFFGINNREIFPYKSGDKKVPIPTYILGPNSEELVQLYPKDDTGDVAENIYYLGKRGLFVNSKGLKIAYLSGISNNTSSDYEYSSNDLLELYEACVRGNPSFRGVDILLTSQWPSNIVEQSKNLTINKYSDFPAWITMKLKPRYLICGLEGIHYERPPFRCPTLGDHDTTLDITTRFIGLARVGNTNKDKWLYALSLTPLDKMKMSELMQKTTDETECPFRFEELEEKIFNKKRKSVGSTQYFYDTATQEEEHTSKIRHKKQKIQFDQSKCWFCLASPAVEKHLIVTVGNFAYLALAKGGLVEEHFLVCPIEHYQSSLSQSQDIQQEIAKFKEALRLFYSRNNQVAVFFERNYKTSHMQLQVVPIPETAVKKLKEIFVEEAEMRGLKLQILDKHNRLDQVLQSNVPFFTAELPNGVVLYTSVQGNFPLNFGREVLAHRSILNMIDRVEWKDCVLQRREEEQLIGRIRKDFGQFDFTNE